MIIHSVAMPTPSQAHHIERWVNNLRGQLFILKVNERWAKYVTRNIHSLHLIQCKDGTATAVALLELEFYIEIAVDEVLDEKLKARKHNNAQFT